MTVALRLAEDPPVLTREGFVHLSGAAVRLDWSGALHWPDEDLVVVADLHFEKGTSRATKGRFLPPYDTRTTLGALEEAIRRLQPKRVIALGDSFHDRDGPERLAAADRARLERLTRAAEFVWITGNHDPELPPSLGGRVVDVLTIGGLTLRHVPEPGALAEIGGHMHPVVSVVGGGRRVRRACFASDGERLLMPAFGELTGGLDLAAPAFSPLLDRRRTTAFALGRDRLHAIPLAGGRGMAAGT